MINQLKDLCDAINMNTLMACNAMIEELSKADSMNDKVTIVRTYCKRRPSCVSFLRLVLDGRFKSLVTYKDVVKNFPKARTLKELGGNFSGPEDGVIRPLGAVLFDLFRGNTSKNVMSNLKTYFGMLYDCCVDREMVIGKRGYQYKSDNRYSDALLSGRALAAILNGDLGVGVWGSIVNRALGEDVIPAFSFSDSTYALFDKRNTYDASHVKYYTKGLKLAVV